MNIPMKYEDVVVKLDVADRAKEIAVSLSVDLKADLDLALSREAALTDHLDAALRQVKANWDYAQDKQQRLTIAEKRTGDLLKALELVTDGGFDPDPRPGSWGAVRITFEDWHIIKAALKPAEDGEGL